MLVQQTYNGMLHVVGAHPLSGGDVGKRRIKAVEMEDQRTVVTLQQGGHSA